MLGAFSAVCCVIDRCFYDSMLSCFLIHNLIVCVIVPFATHIASPSCDEDSDVNSVIDTRHNLKKKKKNILGISVCFSDCSLVSSCNL